MRGLTERGDDPGGEESARLVTGAAPLTAPGYFRRRRTTSPATKRTARSARTARHGGEGARVAAAIPAGAFVPFAGGMASDPTGGVACVAGSADEGDAPLPAIALPPQPAPVASSSVQDAIAPMLDGARPVPAADGESAGPRTARAWG